MGASRLAFVSPTHRNAASRPRRIVSALRQGIAWLNRLSLKGRLWRRVRLIPETWPEPSPNLKIIYHPDT